MATGTPSASISAAGKKKRDIEKKLRQGINPNTISSDWYELDVLYDRAGLTGLYNKDDMVEKYYDPVVSEPWDYSTGTLQDSAGAASPATADTFTEPSEEVDAPIEPPTQEEIDAVDVNSLLSQHGITADTERFDAMSIIADDPTATPAQIYAVTNWIQAQGDAEAEATRDARYNEVLGLLRDNPNRRDINLNDIFASDPVLGKRISDFLNSDEYYAMQRESEVGAAPDTVTETTTETTEEEESVWDYNAELEGIVTKNYANFKDRVAQGIDITSSVADLLLSSGASADVARANAGDAALFIKERAQRELDAEASLK